jgi:hypothetical protein
MIRSAWEGKRDTDKEKEKKSLALLSSDHGDKE